jgi:aminopeptidase N
MKYLLLFISSFALAQQIQSVDFKSVKGQITINPDKKLVSGLVSYWFEVLQPIDTIKIDAQNMEFSEVELNKKTLQFSNDGKQLLLIYPFQKGKNNVSFNYVAKPKQTMYFVGSEEKDNLQVWTQGQGKYTSNWFPSFDDVNEKLVFNLSVVFDANYQVVSNGVLKEKNVNDEVAQWKYEMNKPMSSYLLMVAIGKFEIHNQQSKSGTPLELYLEKKDSAKFEPTYRYSSQIFNFLEAEIGVKYPWKIYKQIPVRDFLYAGMENTSATLFASRYIVDSIGFEDRNYTNVNAHELAHQWFGNLITAESGKHHWLQEGFATYYALLAERDIYGDDYFYSKLYQSAQQIKYASRTDSIPVLDAKASSLSFYQKGAWALFVLHDAIGDLAFKKAVRSYLTKYAFQNVITKNFFDEVRKVSDYDLDSFRKKWLESSEFNNNTVNVLLKKNKMIQLLFEVEKLKKKPLDEKEIFFEKIMRSDAFLTVKEAIVVQLKDEDLIAKKLLLHLALETKEVQIRQAVAITLANIPEDYREEYETLLDDKSYETKEIALYNLWNNFPKFRVKYIDESKNWIGYNDYNLRTLWLSLALSTEDYSIDKSVLIEELINYSSVNFEAITRQNALTKLIAFQLIDDTVLKNMVNATTHHMWQFSKFARDNIRALAKKPEMRASFERILPDLNEKEQFQLRRLIF